jgi:hypothetical protein
VKIKVSEATRIQLDWMVELAKGTHWSVDGYFVFKHPDGTTRTFERNPEWRYSTDWSQGGPIIEREGIATARFSDAPEWGAEIVDGDDYFASVEFKNFGPTLLIAAMRCYVASKLGEEVEVPEELI